VRPLRQLCRAMGYGGFVLLLSRVEKKLEGGMQQPGTCRQFNGYPCMPIFLLTMDSHV
jgi:hypothetical protein